MKAHEFLSLHTISIIPRAFTSRMIGRFCGSWASRPFIKMFIKNFNINVDESEKCLDEYPTLTEFFTRRLKDGARPLDISKDSLVSPVDGVTQESGKLGKCTLVTVKGCTMPAVELLGTMSPEDYSGGGYSIQYLSPSDYHWVHFPCDCKITGWAHIPGDFYPVFPAMIEKHEAIFIRNERIITFVETDFGKMAIVMVAALGVGNMAMTFADVSTNQGGIPIFKELAEPIEVKRGDPLGVFKFGSTVIMLWKNPSLEALPSRLGKHIKMGEELARLVSHK